MTQLRQNLFTGAEQAATKEALRAAKASARFQRRPRAAAARLHGLVGSSANKKHGTYAF